MPDYEADAGAWWAPALERARASLRKKVLSGISDSDFMREYETIHAPTWVPERPPWRAPRLWAIAGYWADRGVFEFDLDRPSCFGCRMLATLPPASGNWTRRQKWDGTRGALQKGHLVNRCCDGLDGVQNLVPLCRRCNKMMPIFSDGPSAIAWVQRGGWLAAFGDWMEAAHGRGWLASYYEQNGVPLPASEDAAAIFFFAAAAQASAEAEAPAKAKAMRWLVRHAERGNRESARKRRTVVPVGTQEALF